MPIDDVELANLAAGHLDPKARVHAGRIDAQLARIVGAGRRDIWLSTYTYHKQRFRHPDVDFRAYRLLPDIFRRALVYRQGARRLIFVSDDANEFAKMFRVCVKHARERDEIYIESFHPIWPKEFRRLVKRARTEGTVVRPAIARS